MKKSSFCSKATHELGVIPRRKPLWPSIRGECVQTIRMQTSANWGVLIVNQENVWAHREHGLMQGVLFQCWPTQVGGEGRHTEQLLVLWCIAVVTSSRPSFDIVLIMTKRGLDVAACTAQLCKAASKDLGDALAIWPPELGKREAGTGFLGAPSSPKCFEKSFLCYQLQTRLPKKQTFDRMSFQALVNIVLMGCIYITNMLSVPVVRRVCFLSGLKNIALKCLRSADYFSVFLCHTNSFALVGKTAQVLSAETCFYNRHGSCVVLAGLCGDKVWRGHGEKLQRALARQACRGHRWGWVAHHWCSVVGRGFEALPPS